MTRQERPAQQTVICLPIEIDITNSTQIREKLAAVFCQDVGVTLESSQLLTRFAPLLALAGASMADNNSYPGPARRTEARRTDE